MNLTPLFPIYQNYNAKIVDFHGWALPVQFSSIIQEHQAVRNKVGLFDVSHMGEILIQGPEAVSFLDYALTNQISGLQPGTIRYSPLCLESGGTVDDLLVYGLEPDKFLLVVNASNINKDFDYLRQASSGYQVNLTDLSQEIALLALQGPLAASVLRELTPTPFTQMGYYQFCHQISLAGLTVLLSRTGYTGEDGFEIYLRSDQAVQLWEVLMKTRASYVQAAGKNFFYFFVMVTVNINGVLKLCFAKFFKNPRFSNLSCAVKYERLAVLFLCPLN